MVRAVAELERGRQSYAKRAWLDAYEALAAADYVDSTLGDSSVNTCFEVDAEQAFAEQALGLRTPAAIRA